MQLNSTDLITCHNCRSHESNIFFAPFLVHTNLLKNSSFDATVAVAPSRTSAELVFILSYCVVCECSFPLNSMAIFSSLLTKNSWVRLLFMESSLAPLERLVTRWLCLFILAIFTKTSSVI